ncbi:50S ribosomal protein L32 [Candidatus Gracilibacteria bacterium]|nr:50S ribosomal protein L32 [Candidatus Gracilibacteria bacterium]
MTFSPTKKMSKSRSSRRTSNWTKLTAKKLLDKTSLQYDKDGNATGLSHFASPVTGEYKGRKVIKVGKTKKVTTIKA